MGLLVPKGGFPQEGNHGPVNSVGSVSVQSSFSELWLGKGKGSLHLNADTGFSPGTGESFSIKMLMKEQTATPNPQQSRALLPAPTSAHSSPPVRAGGLTSFGSFPGRSSHNPMLRPGGCSGETFGHGRSPFQEPGGCFLLK